MSEIIRLIIATRLAEQSICDFWNCSIQLGEEFNLEQPFCLNSRRYKDCLTDMKTLQGMSEIADNYDLFLIDLWGCVHDGTKLFPGVRECLQKLRTAGRVVCLLSNAPRRAETVRESLETLFNLKQGEDFDVLMTSGEQTFRALSNSKAFNIFGNKLFYYGSEVSRGIIADLPNWKEVGVEEADIFLMATPLKPDDNASLAAQTFNIALERNLPLICANPDIGVISGDHFCYCAGAFAASYESLGGQTIYFGKPHPHVYETCLKETKYSGPRSRILAVGDGLKTDIRGANRFGCSSCLLSTGLISAALEEKAAACNADRILDLAQQDNVKLDWFLPSLRWH